MDDKSLTTHAALCNYSFACITYALQRDLHTEQLPLLYAHLQANTALIRTTHSPQYTTALKSYTKCLYPIEMLRHYAGCSELHKSI